MLLLFQNPKTTTRYLHPLTNWLSLLKSATSYWHLVLTAWNGNGYYLRYLFWWQDTFARSAPLPSCQWFHPHPKGVVQSHWSLENMMACGSWKTCLAALFQTLFYQTSPFAEAKGPKRHQGVVIRKGDNYGFIQLGSLRYVWTDIFVGQCWPQVFGFGSDDFPRRFVHFVDARFTLSKVVVVIFSEHVVVGCQRKRIRCFSCLTDGGWLFLRTADWVFQKCWHQNDSPLRLPSSAILSPIGQPWQGFWFLCSYGFPINFQSFPSFEVWGHEWRGVPWQVPQNRPFLDVTRKTCWVATWGY